MKKAAFAVIAAVVAVTFALPAFSQDSNLSPQPKLYEFSGKVTAVDAAAKTMAVDNGYKEVRTFTIADDFWWLMVKKDTKLADQIAYIKVGDMVTCKYTTKGDKFICHRCGPLRRGPSP